MLNWRQQMFHCTFSVDERRFFGYATLARECTLFERYTCLERVKGKGSRVRDIIRARMFSGMREHANNRAFIRVFRGRYLVFEERCRPEAGGCRPPPTGIVLPAVTAKNKAGKWAPGKYQIDCVNIYVCDARTPPAGNGHRQPEKHPAEASEKFSSVLCFTKGCLCLYFIQIHACVHIARAHMRSRKRARRKRFAIARLAIGNFDSHRIARASWRCAPSYP